MRLVLRDTANSLRPAFDSNAAWRHTSITARSYLNSVLR
jgi:hypothetical protein